LPDGHRAQPVQTPAGATPERRDARVRQHDLIRVSCERLTNYDLIRATTRKEDNLEVHSFVPFDCEASP
jgi:hypothetical protein